MTVTIHLSTETARKLRDAAHRRGQTLEDYVQQIAIVSAENEIVSTVNQSAEEWIAEWRAWGASHATLPHAVDDSRESIYEGRGE